MEVIPRRIQRVERGLGHRGRLIAAGLFYPARTLGNRLAEILPASIDANGRFVAINRRLTLTEERKFRIDNATLLAHASGKLHMTRTLTRSQRKRTLVVTVHKSVKRHVASVFRKETPAPVWRHRKMAVVHRPTIVHIDLRKLHLDRKSRRIALRVRSQTNLKNFDSRSKLLARGGNLPPIVFWTIQAHFAKRKGG